MYSEQLLMDYIVTATGYEISLAEELSIKQTSHEVTIPKIQIGHYAIKNQHPEHLFADGYKELEDSKILLTSLRFICLRTELATVWNTLYEAYRGFTPFPLDSDYSHIIYIEGNAVAKTHQHIIWEDILGIAFPRVS
jgi:hypothetical protein